MKSIEDDEKSCFVICPLNKPESKIRARSDQILEKIIKPILEEDFNFKVTRSDQISIPGIITEQIVDRLLDDDLVIADLTYNNPNVMYELGIRHFTKKPFIHLYSKTEEIPFDINQVRAIKIDQMPFRDEIKCKTELRSQVEAILEDPSTISSPVSLVIDLKWLRFREVVENFLNELQTYIFDKIDYTHEDDDQLEAKHREDLFNISSLISRKRGGLFNE